MPNNPLKPPKQGRLANGKFAQGHGFSQPGARSAQGRLKAMADFLAEKTHDGRRTLQILLDIAEDKKIRASDRLTAIDMIHNRMVGKPIDIQATIALNESAVAAQPTLAADILETLIRALPAASGNVVEGETVSDDTSLIPVADPTKSED